MLSLARPLCRAVYPTTLSQRAIHIYGVQDVSPRPYEPLRVLFCGADHFSIASLRAIWELSQDHPEKIHSIDVVCRKDKRVGRGFKRIQAVPVKSVAEDLNLGLHQIDTFTGWQPPPSINLVIAVSFGLLVPARIINGAKYGGLNVHPSLLPDLRGPAPIPHAIMKGRRNTGVSLQTMHPTRFDNGAILAQTEPGSVILSNETTTVELISKLSTIGAKVLRKSLEIGIFVEPVQDIGRALPDATLDHAPKITSDDRHIDWDTWTAAEFSRRDRAVGNLWDLKTSGRVAQTEKNSRTTFAGPWTVLSPEDNDGQKTSGSPSLVASDHGPRLGLRTADGLIISPSTATLEGSPRGTGLTTLIRSLEARNKKSEARDSQDTNIEPRKENRAKI